jgi:hypothetical protein
MKKVNYEIQLRPLAAAYERAGAPSREVSHETP